MSVNKKTFKGSIGAMSFFFPDCYVTDNVQDLKFLPNVYRFILRVDNPEKYKDFILASDAFVVVNSNMFYDYNLTDKESLIELLSTSHKIPSNRINFLRQLRMDEFMDFIKILWVRGNVKINEGDERKLYKLFFVVGGSKTEVLKEYFNVREQFSPLHIFYSLMGMFDRVLNGTDSVSNRYGNKIIQLREKSEKLKRLLLEFIGGCDFYNESEKVFELYLLNFLLMI